jgi:hypothetical protein
MPRYVIEREFPDGLNIPVDANGRKACLAVVDSNAGDQVTWIHSYVSADKKRPFASMMDPRRRRSGAPPAATSCPSSASPRSKSSILTSIRKRCNPLPARGCSWGLACRLRMKCRAQRPQ